MTVVMSDTIKEYFQGIDSSVQVCYALAQKARARGFDPELFVPIPQAKNLAERVEGLISVAAPQVKGSGIIERITQLEQQYGMQDWRVALTIALEVAQEKFCRFETKVTAMEVAIRVGFAYVTVGVVASPLEGFVRLVLKKRGDGKEYFCLYYSGPVRSAGGTGASVSVIIADYVRIHMGYAPYDPTPEEVKRTFSELEHYHNRITNLQYFPSQREAEFLTSHLPVQIDGDQSEQIEVPNYKDLPRVSTNFMRNGFCLVMAECLSLKAPKVWKQLSRWGNDFGLGHWSFLDDFLKIQKEVKAQSSSLKTSEKSSEVKVTPDYTYIKDFVAGRPALSYPLRRGGFRLRYGRARTSGFSANAVHPATLIVLQGLIALGTQLKMERPGKATTIATCDTLEGPIVLLEDGSVHRIETVVQARSVLKKIVTILYLGDMLVNYGDFFNRAHTLLPPGYCEEWWLRELEKAGGSCQDAWHVTVDEALSYSREFSVPLHPRYVFHWTAFSFEQFSLLLQWLSLAAFHDDKIVFPLDEKFSSCKYSLELLGIPHVVVPKEYVVISGEWAVAFRANLGCVDTLFTLPSLNSEKSVLENITALHGFIIRDKSGYFLGARMGRPEKAKMRKMIGSPQVLFPVGDEGGRMRSFQAALENGLVTAQFPLYYCSSCSHETVYPVCHTCHTKTQRKWIVKSSQQIVDEKKDGCVSYSERSVDLRGIFSGALKQLGMQTYPELIKGVRGTSNKEHIPEHLCKGILRAVHGLYVNKDGTIRYDMTEMAVTHFKSQEIGTSVATLRSIGYVSDIYGKELEDDNQILELKCQDLILPACPDSLDDGADVVLLRVAQFLDDLLVKFYGLEPYYRASSREDLVGHLVLGLSPHTSAGIVGRIIGFSHAQGMLAHPLFHSIMRRDVDGDEAGVMLLLDALLNFSPQLLGTHRGATQDEPLVLTSQLIPSEVDDMVFDMDTAWFYPLEFYEACLQYKKPWDVKVEIFKDRLNTVGQFEGLGFTHHTDSINAGVSCSTYKTLPTMDEKVAAQMNLAEKIRAVDASDVARLVIERHFLRDLKGNLRKFSMQQFRCVSCNEKYRRPPLKGLCLLCHGKIIFTISEGSVVKYLQISMDLAEKYDLPVYLRQTLFLLQQQIDMVFGKPKDKQVGLLAFR